MIFLHVDIMVASVTCSQGGHYLTNKILRKVFENKDNFSIIEIQAKKFATYNSE